MNARRLVILVLLSLLLSTSSLVDSPSVAAGSTQMVSYTTIWYDPANLEVNRVRNAISGWVNDQGGVESIQCRDYRWWLTESGWYEELHDLACDATWDTAESHSYSRMKNPWFCSTRDTWTHYDRNHAFLSTVSVSGWSNSWANGGCSSWLWADYWFEPGVYY